MPLLPFFTVDVFTKTRFGGNPLAVVMGGDALDDATMQAIAAEFHLSETTFVLPPDDPANTARVRIFSRTAELAFAGYPMVGTGYVLANQRPNLEFATFEIPAGLVRVEIERSTAGAPIAATIAVPQPLTIGRTFPATMIEQALQLTNGGVVTTAHPPLVASNGNPFIIAELTADALTRCSPHLEKFQAALAEAQDLDRFALHVYTRELHSLRTRMFSPLTGTWEDPATGSANSSLACLLLSLQSEKVEESFVIHQGVEMGRPSILNVVARRAAEGIVATLQGSCVTVMRGEIDC